MTVTCGSWTTGLQEQAESLCSKIAEAEAVVAVNEKKWLVMLVMHVHVQMRLDELRGPPHPWLTVT
jgi:predicted nucleic acid-binding Zn ribbon protein